jgi:chromosome segregation ATPase
MNALEKAALALLREKDARIDELEMTLEVASMNLGDTREWLNDAECKIAEKDAEIERLTKERDDARRDCAVAEQNHYECKKELEEMSDDILDSVRAERDRYKAESERYQSALLKRCAEHEYDYSRGWNEAITEFAERLKKFYSHLKGNTVGGSVEYHIEQIAKEMKGGDGNDQSRMESGV